MINIDEQLIEAEIYKQTSGKKGAIYLAKVSFLDIGLYISGITVKRSLREGAEWWVQLPATYSGKWYNPFEVNQSLPFWVALEDKVLQALKLYLTDNEIVTNIDIDKPITADDFNWPD